MISMRRPVASTSPPSCRWACVAAASRPGADQRVERRRRRRARRRWPVEDPRRRRRRPGAQRHRRSSRPVAVLLLAAMGRRSARRSSARGSSRTAGPAAAASCSASTVRILGRMLKSCFEMPLPQASGARARRPPRRWWPRGRAAPAPGRPSCGVAPSGGAPRHRSDRGSRSARPMGCRWRRRPAAGVERRDDGSSEVATHARFRSRPSARSTATVARTHPARAAVESAYDPFRADSVTAMRPGAQTQPGVVDPVRGRQGHRAPDQLVGLGAAQCSPRRRRGARSSGRRRGGRRSSSARSGPPSRPCRTE